MVSVSKESLPVERQVMTKEDAKKLFQSLNEPFKVELIEEIEGDYVTVYRQGEFVDLCRGPHVNNTGLIKHFKLLSISGAYWRGDENREQLTRIYGTCFWTSDELEEFLHNLEEAERRDHRKLGKQLDLFSINETLAQASYSGTPMVLLLEKKLRTFGGNHTLTMDTNLSIHLMLLELSFGRSQDTSPSTRKICSFDGA